MKDEVRAILEQVRQRDPHQTEFLQAVDEVVESLGPLFEKEPKYIKVCFRVSLYARSVYFASPVLLNLNVTFIMAHNMFYNWTKTHLNDTLLRF